MSPHGRPNGSARSAPRAGAPISLLGTARIVYAKEVIDALRDRRTLLVVLLSSVLLGPLVLVALSGLVASLEARAEKREVFVAGLEIDSQVVRARHQAADIERARGYPPAG